MARKQRSAKTAAKAKRRATARRARAPQAARVEMPTKLSGKTIRPDRDDDEGPEGWFLSQIESSYSRLAAHDAPPVAIAGTPASGIAFASSLRRGEGEAVLATSPGATLWADRLREYKQRKAAATARQRAAIAVGGRARAPMVPGGRNWISLGPTVVLEGQTGGNQPVGGRVVGLAIAPGGDTIYAASASGGVFRSDDGATSWRSLMDGFDVDPTQFAAASLACGAIAIDPADPDRIYVGTGEGETHQMFSRRVVSALPAYRGIGPIRSDDGGTNWIQETTAAASSTLAGEAFFSLAVDPSNRENVIAATSAGLYQRKATGGGGEWTQRRTGVHSSVTVAAAGGTVRFFAAEWGKGVVQSSDGKTWTPAGTGFPASGVSRITLATQTGNPSVVYALVSRDGSGTLHGVYRLDVADGRWRTISNPPDVLPAPQGSSQGDYDLALAIDPANVNRIYLGGSYVAQSPFPASIWRAEVKQTGVNWRFENPTSIGRNAHADVHVLLHSPGDPNELWCGCDGGVFLNRNPTGAADFAGVNTGLSCLSSNFIAQHPTDPNILFTGLQDNGTARTPGGPMWTHVNYGDGGYCVINWNNPKKVLTFVNGRVFRSTTGGETHNDWVEAWNFGWVTMTQPIVGTSFNPAKPAQADVVAVGAGNRVYVSRDFTTTWKPNDTISLSSDTSDNVFAIAFASPDRIFVGTTKGHVFRADFSGSSWTVARLDNVSASPLPISGLITDIAVDWADVTGGSAYISFGGIGDRRRVWHYDGTRWTNRSGSPGNDLLDVEHNALTVDQAAPQNIYAGADIGVWHSADSGATWEPLQNGLPDAPVFDLQIHPTQRLLRAATHGRGIYELALT